jgi:hypothetical protein
MVGEEGCNVLVMVFLLGVEALGERVEGLLPVSNLLYSHSLPHRYRSQKHLRKPSHNGN